MSSGVNKNAEFQLVTGPLKIACSFCKTKQTDELKLGPVYESRGLLVHYFCLLTASSLPQNGEDEEGILGFHIKDIQNELKVTATRTCVYCKKKGASVSCCTQRCKRWFHLTCGRQNNSLHQFFGRFKSFCSVHRPKLPGDKRRPRQDENDDIVCPICYEPVVVESLETLWAPCCKRNAWFHRDCVQKLALSAGYFFKCPLCNNETTFRESMEILGIYIPQRDALWEQVPNAYQELLYQYRRCDAPVCKCPKGRRHNGPSNWELIRCKTCGSQGVHISCGRLKFSDPEWLCGICTDVVNTSVPESVARKNIARSRSASSSSSRSEEAEEGSTAPTSEACNDDSRSSSCSNSSQGRSSSQPIRCTRSNPRPEPFISTESEIVTNIECHSPPIKRSKPCPKRYKKHYVERETEEKDAKKTESPEIEKVNTSISLLKEYPPEENNITVLDSDSDEEIEVV